MLLPADAVQQAEQLFVRKQLSAPPLQLSLAALLALKIFKIRNGWNQPIEKCGNLVDHHVWERKAWNWGGFGLEVLQHADEGAQAQGHGLPPAGPGAPQRPAAGRDGRLRGCKGANSITK